MRRLWRRKFPLPATMMKPETVARLLEINRRFYLDFSSRFSETRSPRQPGLERILPYIPDFCSILDVGCGNGRLAVWLDARGKNADYVGVDFSQRLLEHARAFAENLEHVSARFVQADVTLPGWPEGLPLCQYDVVFAISVLHHIPSQELRRRLLRDFASLLKPGGTVVLTTWQFLGSPRMRRKIVPWEVVGLPPDYLEPGDYLLDWKRGGIGYRYCHLVDEGEMRSLAESAGVELLETFRADGKEGNLNLYGVMRKTSR